MRLKYFSLFIVGVIFQEFNLFGQPEAPINKTIEGLDFGVLPSFVYSPDKGLQYGMLANFYYYDKNKSKYPNYLFNLYLQISRTTRNGYANYLFFDSRHLLPRGLRLTVNLEVTKRGFQQFYGFNGYNSILNQNFINQSNYQYISHNYYFLEELSRIGTIDVQKNILIPHLFWDFGFGYYHISTMPFRNYRKGQTPLPTLFEKYIHEGIIPQNQKNGGITSYIKTSIIYDTRNDETSPTKGIWVEGIYTNAPAFFANTQSYSLATIKFHEYISLFPSLVFAYRLAYQTKISGNIPFFMLPDLMGSYRNEEALGGNKTIRGIVNRRLVGNGFALGNFELRYVPFHKIILQKTLDIGFNLFEDMGKITNKYSISSTANFSKFDYQPEYESMHYSVGAGVKFIVNHNFIVAIDFGSALDKRDGTNGLYIDLDYLF